GVVVRVVGTRGNACARCPTSDIRVVNIGGNTHFEGVIRRIGPTQAGDRVWSPGFGIRRVIVIVDERRTRFERAGERRPERVFGADIARIFPEITALTLLEGED